MRCADCDFPLRDCDFRTDPTGTLCSRCYEINKDYLDEALHRPKQDDENH
jgi:hypothetical protein